MDASKVTEPFAGGISLRWGSPTQRLVRDNQTLAQWLQLIANGGAVVGILFALAADRVGYVSEHYRVLAVVSLLVLLIVYHTPIALGPFGMPRQRHLNPWSGMGRIARTWIITCGVILFLGFVTKTSANYSRQLLLTWFIGALLAQCLIHVLFTALLRIWQMNVRVNLPVLVVGAGSLGRQLIDRINDNVFIPDRVVGVVDDPAELAQWTGDHAPALGTLDKLEEIIQKNPVDRVYIALSAERVSEVARLNHALQHHNVDLIWAPDIFSLELLNPSVRELSGIPLISLSESPLNSGVRAYVKSLMDVTGAVVALALFGPVMIAAAIAIKLTSPGPVLFRQMRTGWDGGVFEIWKFRSMHTHDEGANKVTQACRDDSRVTPVGRFLRRTSIDELPQLFNVLSGTMSLVGPRPHSIIHDQEYSKRVEAYAKRHRIKPGMTGWAQVHGYRGETRDVREMRRRVEHDLYYINNWSLTLDIWILLMTPIALFSRRAY